MEPRIWEDGDRIYMVCPVSPLTPGQSELQEFAFAEQLKSAAPNENILWLRGQYVEADRPNRNNQMWTADELAIKALTPNFMPVTVMHDPRTAVGLIADTRLLLPEKDSVARSRIDSTLAVWAHRFPEIAEECQVNYEAGTLMQSMEAISPYYSCADCGKVFQKLPEQAERANWCAHLKGDGSQVLRGEEGSAAARILGNVTFTGTGLIFGTRGAQGAYREAHLEVDQEEIAEFHREAHERTSHTKTSPRPKQEPRSSQKMDIDQARYDELMARPTKEELAQEKTRADEAEQAKVEAERKVEELETAKKKAEKDLEEANTALDEAKEEGRKAELASERLGALGNDFKDALGEFTSKRLDEQAKTLSDEEWDARLTELEELSEVKRDATSEEDDDDDAKGGKGKSTSRGKGKDGEFSREEVAAARLGNGKNGGDGTEPSPEERRSVVGSLIPARKTAETK